VRQERHPFRTAFTHNWGLGWFDDDRCRNQVTGRRCRWSAAPNRALDRPDRCTRGSRLPLATPRRRAGVAPVVGRAERCRSARGTTTREDCAAEERGAWRHVLQTRRSMPEMRAAG
jgi:hypothetical protein